MKTTLAGFLTTKLYLRKQESKSPLIAVTDKLRLGLEIKNINEILEKFLKLFDDTSGRDFTSEEQKTANKLREELNEIGLQMVDAKVFHTKEGNREMEIIFYDYLGLPN
ncbi:MAG: hypothetical protein A2750_02865 [Candidatus Yanofskybacteria bacterium RIFCSPHIGHO2_01_FULL_45_42]|uniref:Uncharacterized protein n=3 Tax=Candidatus Yanofskyibacteriota TaxID=1752733 RepID=A0A1F8F3M7_9BACT|nr:MAG: hypothetical protein A2750_02865 [Candidatus Yanofskybacteria bacterium RIFCSPHIGHO2_01_FULL_45_42]OGN16464.1 MAG: hypothetical protein A3C81_00660 [Candidatus Yanofskybacteria bacterium RIFCSPHIGHO2_02_FULL_46_19]OGN27347.1 MAG: hypothetical protein A3B17_00070 [Candidatus Yanofskybacteria bacterium RIFCSPLOWO2_01_FULL_45_72]OGN31668.1 MAG: hypothetical protein A3J01_02095 [Candidatus Yanofskybacteria bacterium RIFCSPLOWO2_02_FULL_45_18]